MIVSKYKNFSRIIFWLSVSAFLVVLFLAVTLISSAAYDLAVGTISSVRFWDPADTFLLISVHHVYQAIIAFAVIAVLSLLLQKPISSFGFNTNNWPVAVLSVLIFSAVWFVVQMVASIVVSRVTSLDTTLGYPLTAGNFIGNFLFELLLSGTSEEILFRAMTIPLMMMVFQKLIHCESLAWGAAITVSTLVFTLAHINFNLYPFRITNFNLAQLITCVIFGVYYGLLMKKTGSILGPMLAHNLLNGVITLSSLIMTIAL